MSMRRHLLRASTVALLGTLAPWACSIRIDWPRHEVRVEAIEGGMSQPMQARVGDVEVRVDRAYLVVSAITLTACDAKPSLPWQTLAALAPPLIPSAQAHGPTTPTRLGQQHVLALHRAERRVVLGMMEPPPGDYCAMVIDVAAADVDAPGLPEDRAPVGSSLWIEGAWRRVGDVAWTPQVWATSASFDVRARPAEGAVWRFGDDDAQQGALSARMGDLTRLFEGVGVGVDPPDVQARRLLSNACAVLTLDASLDEARP